ncbi:MAG: tRNA (adenosine(37)-N6)-threonylcarbamoyltransferase complex ATPase subunit type 1 TsaE [Chthoniobacterales bacterium]|nr:tRNA (adenosine(37)-N6)-threonylcarbamoyltransferase complex ATPase subunit type 1 TsaE [Chthoniobacterales bacterium]
MFISHSAEQTRDAGGKCAGAATRGDIFALAGDLGAGKTQFAKGFVRQIGSDAEVTSPTFTLIHEYGGGRIPVYHLDLYRLDSPEAATRLGLDEYLHGDGVCLIEWAQRFPALLPESTRWIVFRTTGENSRVIDGIDAR